MDKIKKFIDKSMLGFTGEENPYSHDLIQQVLLQLDSLNPDNFRDRLQNQQLYANTASLLSWVHKHRLQYTPLGKSGNQVIGGFSTNLNFGKKICNHPNYRVFTFN